MSPSRIDRFDLADPVHGVVPCAAILPPDRSAPICLFLYGGGGSRETLVEIAPLIASVPMVFVTPDVGPLGFDLDDPARGMAWETFVGDRLIDGVRARL